MEEVTEEINDKNFLDNHGGYLKIKYGDDFYNKLINLVNISLKDFKWFCNNEKTMTFLNSESEVEIAIIKEIIKLFSWKEKYYYLKYLWCFIKNENLSNEILKILKDNAPSSEELKMVERLSPPMCEWIENIRKNTALHVLSII